MIILDTDFAPWEGERPKGRVQFSVYDEQVLMYVISGRIDKNLFDVFSSIHGPALKKIKHGGGRWYAMFVFSDVTEVTDEALDVLHYYLVALKEKQLLSQYAALVFPDEYFFSKDKQAAFLECYTTAGATSKGFQRENDALDWLFSCGES
ncbi:MAG: hypothetical protein HWE30_03190 [Methylocystaceae bacterium]|nr:hypothetical protein [Methylocystaceae bacterium]